MKSCSLTTVADGLCTSQTQGVYFYSRLSLRRGRLRERQVSWKSSSSHAGEVRSSCRRSARKDCLASAQFRGRHLASCWSFLPILRSFGERSSTTSGSLSVAFKTCLTVPYWPCLQINLSSAGVCSGLEVLHFFIFLLDLSSSGSESSKHFDTINSLNLCFGWFYYSHLLFAAASQPQGWNRDLSDPISQSRLLLYVADKTPGLLSSFQCKWSHLE